jgi:hypothetical protein
MAAVAVRLCFHTRTIATAAGAAVALQVGEDALLPVGTVIGASH